MELFSFVVGILYTYPWCRKDHLYIQSYWCAITRSASITVRAVQCHFSFHWWGLNCINSSYILKTDTLYLAHDIVCAIYGSLTTAGPWVLALGVAFLMSFIWSCATFWNHKYVLCWVFFSHHSCHAYQLIIIQCLGDCRAEWLRYMYWTLNHEIVCSSPSIRTLSLHYLKSLGKICTRNVLRFTQP